MLRPGSIVAKTLALTILAVVILAGYQVIVQPLITAYAETKDDIAQSSEILRRYKVLASEKPALNERLAAIREDDAVHLGYLEGESDALAAAELQDLAAEAIDAADGQIKSTQILNVTEVEDGPSSVRKTGLKLRFTATIDGLAAALYDLETIEPHLFIDNLAVVSNHRRSRNNEVENEVTLDIRMDIFGYSRQRPDSSLE